MPIKDTFYMQWQNHTFTMLLEIQVAFFFFEATNNRMFYYNAISVTKSTTLFRRLRFSRNSLGIKIYPEKK